MRLAINGCDVDITANGNDKETMRFLCKVALWAEEAADCYAEQGLRSPARVAYDASIEIRKALRENGFYYDPEC